MKADDAFQNCVLTWKRKCCPCYSKKQFRCIQYTRMSIFLFFPSLAIVFVIIASLLFSFVFVFIFLNCIVFSDSHFLSRLFLFSSDIDVFHFYFMLFFSFLDFFLHLFSSIYFILSLTLIFLHILFIAP